MAPAASKPVTGKAMAPTEAPAAQPVAIPTASGPAGSAGDATVVTVKCSNCGQDVPETKIVPRTKRCTHCNSLQGRIQRVIEKHPEYGLDWEDMQAPQKQEFYAKGRDLYGPTLEAAVEHTLEHIVNEKLSKSFAGSGSWLDLEDLTLKYREKPKQLAEIKANARTMTCPKRKVELYEDMTYSSSFSSTTEYLKSQAMKYEANKRLKADKEPKAKAIKKTPEGIIVPKPISEGNLKQMHKLCLIGTEKVAELEGLVAAIKGDAGISGLVPTYLMQRASLVAIKAKEELAASEMMHGAKMGDAKGMLTTLKATKETLINMSQALELQKEQAEEMGGTVFPAA
jgi:hypothetical protein